MVSNSAMCQDRATSGNTIQIDLIGVNVNAADWTKFQGLVMLSEKAKKQFISDMLSSVVHELLYRNPELFTAYASLQFE